jgi:hypothetical protein
MYLELGSTTTLVSNAIYNCIIRDNTAANAASGYGVYQQKIGQTAALLYNWTPDVTVVDEDDQGGIPAKGP